MTSLLEAEARATPDVQVALAALGQRLITVFATVVTLAVAATRLDHSQFGIWIMACNAVVLAQFADFGMGQSLVTPLARAFGARDLDRSRGLVAAAVRRTVATGAGVAALVAACVVGVSAASDGGHVSALHAWIAVVVGAALLGQVLASVLTRALLALGQPRAISAINASSGVAQTAVVLVALLLLDGGLLAAVISYCITAPLVVLVCSFVIVRRELGGVVGLGPADEELHDAGPALAISIAEVVAYECDPLIVGSTLGAASAGTYGLAYRAYSIVPNILGAVLLARWPVAANAAGRGSRARLPGRRFWAVAVGVCTLTLAVATVGFHLVRLDATDDLAASPVALVAMHAIFWPVNLLRMSVVLRLYAEERYREVARVVCPLAVANVALSVLLARRFGLAGPLIASTTLQLAQIALLLRRPAAPGGREVFAMRPDRTARAAT